MDRLLPTLLDVLDYSAVGLFLLDADHRIVWLNQAMARYFDLSRTEVLGADKAALVRTWIQHLFADPEAFARRVLATYSDNTYVECFECHVLPGPDRTERWLEHWSQPIRSGPYAGGRVEYYTDITARKQTELQLRKWEAIFRHALEGIAILDRDGRFITVNPAVTTATGYTEGEILGQSTRYTLLPEEESAFHGIWGTLTREGYWQGEVWPRRKNGEVFPAWLALTAVRDMEGELTCYIGVFIDITEFKEVQEKLEYLAYHDPLTGLANRRALEEHLTRALQRAQRTEQSLALFYLDLDGFKEINTRFGHAVGDQLLQAAAIRLIGCVREVDFLARIGGDELVLITEGLDKATVCASRVAGRLLEAFQAPFQLTDRCFVVGLSIGISLYPSDGSKAADLLQNADTALYEAKRQGRHRYQFYSGE